MYACHKRENGNLLFDMPLNLVIHPNLIRSEFSIVLIFHILPPIFVDLRISQEDLDYILLYPEKVLALVE